MLSMDANIVAVSLPSIGSPRPPKNASFRTSFARLGIHRLQRRVSLAFRTAQTKGFALRKLCSAFLDATYRPILR